MSKVVIKLVDENEKFDKVKLVKPNITFNRADLMYGEKFGLLEVQNSGRTAAKHFVGIRACHWMT